MIAKKLEYCKVCGDERPLEDKGATDEEIIEEEHEESLDAIDLSVPIDYQKGMPSIDVDKVFIVSGGTTRERKYFEQFKPSKHLSIIFVSEEGQGLIPENMIAVTKKSKRNGFFTDYYGVNHAYFSGDKIYLVQDVDHFGKELKTFYLRDKAQSLYQWIISNPCLEIWLYYHYYKDTTLISECKSEDRTSKSGWLKKKVGSIVSGGVNPTKVINKTQCAIDNARLHIAFDEDGFPELFMTEMYIVAEHIVSIMGRDELKEIILQREKEARLKKEKYMK